MTTRVTVDTHAGWPVQVIGLRGEPHMEQETVVTIVEPLTTRDFYIHSGFKIIMVEELVK